MEDVVALCNALNANSGAVAARRPRRGPCLEDFFNEVFDRDDANLFENCNERRGAERGAKHPVLDCGEQQCHSLIPGNTVL